MRGGFFTETNNQKHHVYYQYTTANVLSSLNILAYGHDICTPRSPVIGPVRRPFYCIHYILRGSGEYTVNHTHYRLEPGTIFFIPMGAEVQYGPNKQDPWEYVWISFTGTDARSLCETVRLHVNPVYRPHSPKMEQTMKRLLDAPPGIVSRELACLSILLEAFALLADESTPTSTKTNHKRDYVNRATAYIQQNFTNCRLQLNQISRKVNVSPNYLSSVFKELTGQTITQFVLQLRLNRACELLEKGNYTLQDIAAQAGFSDAQYFSRMFKKQFGISPKRYTAQSAVEVEE